ncbi:MAG: transcriptional regulator, partial [Puniceicoccaceae bacterium]
KKTPAKKDDPKNATAKNTAAKKAVAKKETAKKAAASKSSAPKKAAAKKSAATSAAPKTKTAAETNGANAARKKVLDKFRGKNRGGRAISLSLEEALELAKTNQKRESAAPSATPAPAKPTATKTTVTPEAPQEKRVFKAASLADILGFNPAAGGPQQDEESRIDKKYLRYYRLLVELRDHVKSGLSLHAQDTLKRSSKEDSGDLSSYGQHMADAGTDTFDRDFALSLVSNEQEALHEIEEAIKRIHKGTYGVCELTGKPISKERLLAVPFARYSVESQAEIEKHRRRSVHRGGAFLESSEEGARFIEDDGDE